MRKIYPLFYLISERVIFGIRERKVAHSSEKEHFLLEKLSPLIQFFQNDCFLRFFRSDFQFRNGENFRHI